MSTTSRRRTPGSRPAWSGLVDVLLGRSPARNAGFFRRSPAQDGQADGQRAGAADARAAATVEPAQPEAAQPEPAQPEPAQPEPTQPQPAHAEAVQPETAQSAAQAEPAPGVVESEAAEPEPVGGDQAEHAEAEDIRTSSGGLRVQAERVSLAAELGIGGVDGVWWPRSDRAADEVGELVEALGEDLGRLTRLALPMSDWSDEQPRVVRVAGHPRHLGWFAGLRRHTVHLTFEGDATAVLLVLPADTDESAARAVLGAVGECRSRAELLERAGVDVDEQPAPGRHEAEQQASEQRSGEQPTDSD